MTILDAQPIATTLATTLTNTGIKISAVAGKLTLDILTKIVKESLEQVKKIPAVPLNPEHGQQTIKYLQYASKGDLHNQTVDKSLLKDLRHDFQKRGLDFAIEKGKDGQTYIHFKGADIDAVKHGLTQAQQRLENRLARKETRQDVKQALQNKVKEKLANHTVKTPSITQTKITKPKL